MNKFVSSLLGAFVGTWIAFFLMGIFIFFVGIMIITSASLSSVSIEVKDNSILRIDLSGSITDKPYNKTLQDILEGSSDDGNSLHEILAAIDNASTDDRIKGIYLRCDAANTGMATASAIRKALSDFKKESGKWIYAYGHSYSQLDYYIASVADSLFINPSGMLDIHGLTATTMYYKELLDKIGVDVQIVKVGTFKSATEPFSQTSMSEANRLQSQTYLNNMWSVLRDDIAKSRKIKADAITEYADSLYMFRQPTLAKEKGFIDGICYEHQFESKLHRKIGIANDEELNLISASQFANAMFIEKSPADNRIAVLYAEGEINTTGDEYSINSEEIVPQIIELADDPAIKGMVLRVNSPGGSAYASEQIWEALEYFKSKKKPLAVSMGDYAASGGYYISCGADRIFAEPTTITGSIGIFGMIPTVKTLLNDKIGITTDYVSTTPNANLTIFEPLTSTQLNAIQQNVNQGYELFVSRCAKGRKVSSDSIKSIAEGRVWDGGNALKIGLIDQFGGISEAVSWVAQKAKLTQTDYTIDYYPEYTPDIINLIYNSLGSSIQSKHLYFNGEDITNTINRIQKILDTDRIQCRMENIYIR